MALRCEIDFTKRPNGPLTGNWDNSIDPIQWTPHARDLTVKNGVMRVEATAWEVFWGWLSAPSCAEYLVTPKLDAPLKAIGAEFKFTSKTTRNASGVIGIIDGPAIGVPNPNVGVHLAFLPDYGYINSREGTTFYNAKGEPNSDDRFKGALQLNTLYRIQATLDHSTQTVSLETPWGSFSYTSERYDRLSKNYGFFEQWVPNLLKDNFIDYTRVWASAE